MPHILCTDPVFVKDPVQFSLNIGEASPSSNALHVKVPITMGLLKAIEEQDAFVQSSKESDETFYRFGRRRANLKDYKFIGWHISESGLCCFVPDEAPEDGIDQLELMLTNLQNPQLQRDRDEFPYLLWFWRTPDEASSVRVYGCDWSEESEEFEGLLLRPGREEAEVNDVASDDVKQ